jgi:hypothetical protein
MAREPGTSFPSETRQLTRQDRLRSDGGGGGPSWPIVIIVVIMVAGVVAYAVAR